MKILVYDSGYGVVPFIEYALKNERLHDYYCYLDEEAFPLGEKDEDYLKNHLTYLLSIWEKEGYDYIVLACNTISSMLDKIDRRNYKCKILSIFEFNKSLIDSDTVFLGTKRAISGLECQTLDCSILPVLIENESILDIINFVSRLDITNRRAVLGCTHFPLIKNIFTSLFYNVDFIDGHKLLMQTIEPGNSLSIKGNSKGIKMIEKFFPSFKS